MAAAQPLGNAQARLELPRGEMPWWEYDPNESPVSLTALGSDREPDELLPDSPSQIPAERVPAFEPPASSAADGIPSWAWTVPRERLLVVVAMWVAACLVMFALGWRQGSATGFPGRSRDSIPSIERYLSDRGVSQVTSRVASDSFTEGLAVGYSGDSKEVVNR